MRRAFFLSIFILLLLFDCSFSEIALTIAENDDSNAYAWWNTNWMYRRSVKITENSGYSLENFPVEVVFEHNGHVQVDGDDIRVIVDGLEISSYVSEVNGTHAKVIFEVNITASITKTIYFYYGNPNAVSPSYPLVSLTITEGNNGHATIDNLVYIGWAYTSWGWSNNVELWDDFRVDFNGNDDPRDDRDLISGDYNNRHSGIGRHIKDIEAIGLGNYQGFIQTPIYVDINFASCSLRIYKNNLWVETVQADFLWIFDPSWDYANYGTGSEQNIIDGKNVNVTTSYPWNDIYNSRVSPEWMAYRNSVFGEILGSVGVNIGEGYNYSFATKEGSDWNRKISYFGIEPYFPFGPYDQPSDCKIFWYADNTNGYSNIERTAKILNNQPSIYVGDEELQGPYVVIDQSFVSDERADVGSTQAVGFHARWDNGSDVVGGIINVERTVNKRKITLQKILTGLVGYWKFDEGNGILAYDSSGNNNTGILVNGPTWVDGKYGQALSFDGIDDYVNCGLQNLGSILGESTTFVFWLNTSQNKSALVGDYGVRLMGSENDNVRTTLLFEPNVPEMDKINLILKDEDSRKLGVRLKDAFDFTGTGWHNFALVIKPKANVVDIYIDGVKREVVYYYQETPNRFSDFQYPYAIGAGYCAGVVETFYEGLIDEVHIFNRALAPSEINAYTHDLLNVLNLSSGQKVELYDINGNLESSSIVGLGENEAILNVSSLTYPFSGFFKLYAIDGSLLFTSPILEDIRGGDEYLVSTNLETEIISVSEFDTNNTGWVTFDVCSSTIGKEFWTVAGVNVGGVEYYYSQLAVDPSMIWDRVNITLQVENNRISIGSTANITWTGSYEYDESIFSGTITYNDTLTRNIVGKYGYAVASVTDPLYGLTKFDTNRVYCIFDRIKTKTIFETLTPGSIQAILNLNFEYDNSPVEDAIIRVNGLAVRYLGSGQYLVTLSSWMPYLQTTFEVERAGFDTLTSNNVIYPLGNIIFEVTSLMAISIVVFFMNARRIRMKEWNTKIKRLEELMKNKGRIEVKRLSESIETDITKTKKLFFDLETKNPALKGFFINNGREFMLEYTFVSSITRMDRADFEKIGSDLGISMTQAKDIINNLLKEGKIKGSILLDGRIFITESQLSREVRNLVSFQAEKKGKIDIHNLSIESSIPEEKFSSIIEELKNQIIETISPYKNIRITDISHENKLPVTLILILVKGLISEGRINGSIDMVNQLLIIEQETKMIKPTVAWFLVPLILGILGGVIGYLAIKNDDRKMANNVLYLGIIMTLIGIFAGILSYSWWWSIILKLLF